MIICIACWVGIHEARAQAGEYRIYGDIYTVMNTKVSGYITWGKCLYWSDLFRAMKTANTYTDYMDVISREGGNQVEGFMQTHLFSCRFGNIRRVRLVGQNRVELEIRDGNRIELKDWRPGGYYVTIEADEKRQIQWDHVSEIVFRAVPDGAAAPKDVPITGVVETRYGMYKGIVQWDLDENSLDHLLDGRVESSGVSVAFKNIKSILGLQNSCKVTLQSGRELSMWGENDVDQRNRGIAVSMPSVGQVIVHWDDFRAFRALPLNEVKLMTYDDFPGPGRLRGQVETNNGKILEGIIVFDLDESMNFELLDGWNGNVQYRIPFRNLQVIEPKNHKYTWIQLRSGAELVLGNERDVNSDNDGLLLFRGTDDVTYLRWRDVKRITLWTNDNADE